jgi:hypothetical protein
MFNCFEGLALEILNPINLMIDLMALLKDLVEETNV